MSVAIFVPHAGCPQQCSFCDQRMISGKTAPPSPKEARETAEKAAKTMKRGTAQLAFFGGSFTAMDREYMISLLKSVQGFIDDGTYRGIRISTRPDAIDEETLEILKRYNVTDIELGAQSMSDEVLRANMRGHTAKDTQAAARLIRESGFGLGLQMMVGLYKDTPNTIRHTAQSIIDITPDTARIYPVLVLKGTMLEQLYNDGLYRPLDVEEATSQCAGLLSDFLKNGIKVIRVGLHDSPELKESFVAGPYHPALRELCESKLMLREALDEIERNVFRGRELELLVSPACVSRMTGQKRENIKKLKDMGFEARVLADAGMEHLKVKVRTVKADASQLD